MCMNLGAYTWITQSPTDAHNFLVKLLEHANSPFPCPVYSVRECSHLPKGTTSLAYYSPNGKIPTVDNTPEEDKKPNETVPTTPVDTETKAPDATETTDAVDSTAEEKEGGLLSGCGSSVAFAGVGLLVTAVGVALMKKREDQE